MKEFKEEDLVKFRELRNDAQNEQWRPGEGGGRGIYEENDNRRFESFCNYMYSHRNTIECALEFYLKEKKK